MISHRLRHGRAPHRHGSAGPGSAWDRPAAPVQRVIWLLVAGLLFTVALLLRPAPISISSVVWSLLPLALVTVPVVWTGRVARRQLAQTLTEHRRSPAARISAR